MNPGRRLYEDLLTNRCAPSMNAYWPEANTIVATLTKVQQLDAFYAHATVRAHHRFFEPWEPDTNDFFASMLAAKKEAKTVDKVDMLLRLWTKAGTLLPPEQRHSEAIGAYLSQCDVATGCRLLTFAPGASKTLPTETLDKWLETAGPYASTRPDPSPLSFFAYHHGELAGLNDAQRDAALRHCVDPPNTWSPPFSAGPLMAIGHPEPARLQLAFLHRMLHAAFRQGPISAFDTKPPMCYHGGMTTPLGSIIDVTPAAARHITKSLAKRGRGLGIRMGIKTTGCSGLAYTFEYVDAPNQDDVEVEREGVRVFVDPKSMAYLAGTTVDFERNGLNEGFVFRNPNERDRCGCGESFRV